MWESPINVMEIQEPIIEQLNNEREEMVLKQIWKIGVDVNKEELIKALQYDRNQYEKGYKDGYAKAIDEFAERLKEKSSDILVWLMERQEDGYGTSNGELHEKWLSRIDEIAEQLKGGAIDG